MAEMQVSRQDLDTAAQAVSALSAPAAPKELLATILSVISDAMDNPGPPVTVTVTPDPSFRHQFDAAFTAAEVDEPTVGGMTGSTAGRVDSATVKVGR